MKKILYILAIASITFVACKKDSDSTAPAGTTSTTGTVNTDLTLAEIATALDIVAQPVPINASGDTTKITRNPDGSVTRKIIQLDSTYTDKIWTINNKVDGRVAIELFVSLDSATYKANGKLQKDGSINVTNIEGQVYQDLDFVINPDNSYKQVERFQIVDSLDSGSVSLYNFILTTNFKADGTEEKKLVKDGEIIYISKKDIKGIESFETNIKDTIITYTLRPIQKFSYRPCDYNGGNYCCPFRYLKVGENFYPFSHQAEKLVRIQIPSSNNIVKYKYVLIARNTAKQYYKSIVFTSHNLDNGIKPGVITSVQNCEKYWPLAK